MIFRVTR